MSSSSSLLTSTVEPLLQFNPLQSPQAAKQLIPFAWQKQIVLLQGFLDVTLQLHLIIFNNS